MEQLSLSLSVPGMYSIKRCEKGERGKNWKWGNCSCFVNNWKLRIHPTDFTCDCQVGGKWKFKCSGYFLPHRACSFQLCYSKAIKKRPLHSYSIFFILCCVFMVKYSCCDLWRSPLSRTSEKLVPSVPMGQANHLCHVWCCCKRDSPL